MALLQWCCCLAFFFICRKLKSKPRSFIQEVLWKRVTNRYGSSDLYEESEKIEDVRAFPE